MNADLLLALQAMRPKIRARWEALLRVERLHTPLAHPDILVYMFDRTLDEVLAALPGRPVRTAGKRPTCMHEGNPMRDYFPALEQALLEALIHAQAGRPGPLPGSHTAAVTERTAAVVELCATLRRIARREIAAFDKVCLPPVRTGRRVPKAAARHGSS
jgi:hypothetical protein